MKSKMKKWVAVIGLIAFCLLAIGGVVGAEARQLSPKATSGAKLGTQKENSTSKPNDPGNSAVMDGGFLSRAKAWAKDHGLGALYGVGVGLGVGLVAVGVAALLTVSAPVLLVIGVASVVAGGIYGLVTGAVKFDVWDCVIFSAIAAVSGGIGSGLPAAGLLGWLGRGAVEGVGGGLTMVGSYLLHTDHPTWGGAGQAFVIGAATALAFMGLGAGVNKLFGPSLAKAGAWVRNLLPSGRGARAAAGEAGEVGLTAGGRTTAVGRAAGRGSRMVAESLEPGSGSGSGSALEAEAAVAAEGAVVERVGTGEAGLGVLETSEREAAQTVNIGSGQSASKAAQVLPRMGSHRELTAIGAKDSHHIIQHAAVKEIPGYSRYDAPAIEVPGPPTLAGSPHYRATQAQRLPGGGSYSAEREIARTALQAAGLSDDQIAQALANADEYFRSLGVTMDTPIRVPGNRMR